MTLLSARAVYALAHRLPSYVRYRTEGPLAGRDNSRGVALRDESRGPYAASHGRAYRR